jgi:phosphoglucosamine mutase
VLLAVQRGGGTLASLLEGVELFPQTLVNVRLPRLDGWQSDAGLAREQAAVAAELGDDGRVLIRASGTEPVLRVMVEARDPEVAERSARRLASAALASAGV